ncbi:MAG: sodium-dependent bicarbonate transport family permease, partial [Halioglobus sp.]|nr:sodium-dependent bicarbonate transport family permease [Halioglobus sp.]
LFAIGFKGGVALAESTLDSAVWLTLLAVMALSALVPLYSFFVLRLRFSVADAAATAATYGSVSAVTFITAAGYLTAQGVDWSGFMVAAMALMESPAIIVGILLYTRFREGAAGTSQNSQGIDWPELLRESCLNGSVLLILGSMLIGWITGPAGMLQVAPVVKELFLGILCLFLLDMGIVAARRLKDLRRSIGGRGANASPLPWMIGLALLFPVINAGISLAAGMLLNLNEGDLVLLTVLGASASYIAVPAAMRLALPEANPSTYLPMSLAITFPFNLLIGIPVYHQLARWLLAG